MWEEEHELMKRQLGWTGAIVACLLLGAIMVLLTILIIRLAT